MADTGINEVRARSWFCVFNNPEEHGYAGTERLSVLVTVQGAKARRKRGPRKL